jgi:hypothetical protein
MHVTLNMASGNRKVGAIPVSTTEAGSCPSSCPLMSPEGAGNAKDGDCYAAFGPLGMHWRKIGKDGRGIMWSLFCKAIKKLPKGQLWRHNQAGDLPKGGVDGSGRDVVDAEKCFELSNASRGKRGWTYTHYDMSSSINRAVVQEMNDVDGLTVNLSADSLHSTRLRDASQRCTASGNQNTKRFARCRLSRSNSGRYELCEV